MLDGLLCAFELLVDNSMPTRIEQCAEAAAHRVKNSDEWRLPLSELKAFISLLYVREALCGKNRPILEFWDTNWGVSFFPETMGRNCFCEIIRFLRFDMRSTRLSRLQTDKFAFFVAVWRGIHSRSDTNRTGAEDLSFYYPRLLYCLNWQ